MQRIPGTRMSADDEPPTAGIRQCNSVVHIRTVAEAAVVMIHCRSINRYRSHNRLRNTIPPGIGAGTKTGQAVWSGNDARLTANMKIIGNTVLSAPSYLGSIPIGGAKRVVIATNADECETQPREHLNRRVS